MTKEITKAYILQQMQDKFGLREMVPSRFLFDETVIPTYDISAHLETREVETKIVSITGIAGFLFFTIPDDERWQFSNYNLTFYNVGAYTVVGTYATRVSSGPTEYIYYDMKAGQANSYAVHLNTPVIMDPGDTINVNIDGYVSPANLRLGIDVQKYKLR